jgi:hypothetical protein
MRLDMRPLKLFFFFFLALLGVVSGVGGVAGGEGRGVLAALGAGQGRTHISGCSGSGGDVPFMVWVCYP